MKNQFGGLWTREKLNILEKYLVFYTTAMKNQPFTLHYVDAFAGTGKQELRISGLQEDFLPEEDLDGSVRIALESEPGFSHYHFNDLNPENAAEIRKIAESEYPSKSVFVREMDANEFVPAFCSSLKANDRAVLFLDPFSTQLDWETVNQIAHSDRIDLWLLFPISVILRMTPRDGVKLKPEWRDTLNRLLGTSDWEAALYRAKGKPPIDDLFGVERRDELTERINVEELQDWVTNRLKSVFAYVAAPKLLTNNGRPLFLFYFAVSNKSPAARGLADRAIRSIMR